MTSVFADTSFLLALLLTSDRHHSSALALIKKVSPPILTTVWILAELGNALAKPRHRKFFVKFVTDAKERRDVIIVPPSWQLFDRGFTLFSNREDKAWSLTDCISFAVMEDMGIRDALTRDHHFEQAGFRALMLEP